MPVGLSEWSKEVATPMLYNAMIRLVCRKFYFFIFEQRWKLNKPIFSSSVRYPAMHAAPYCRSVILNWKLLRKPWQKELLRRLQFQWKTDNFKKSRGGNCLLLSQCSYAYVLAHTCGHWVAGRCFGVKLLKSRNYLRYFGSFNLFAVDKDILYFVK